MKKITVAALTLAFSAPAFAQDPPNRDVTEHSFDDADQVEGGRSTAWGDRLHVPPRRQRRTLLRPRTHFIPELMKSVENL